MIICSVLIPVHDYNCYPLVAQLQPQLEASGLPYEVLVADDGSRDQVSIIANYKINELPNCQYLRRPDNIGRAAIRNWLADEAQGQWLLFIDCDAKVPDAHFIAHYMETIQSSAQVVVGGLRNVPHCPDPRVSLRYRYEQEADKHRNAGQRSLHPYLHFSTFNFMILRTTFMAIRFDEHCREYGYEDALFGIQLQELGTPVLHIDNPLIHLGLEPNAIYLQKTETALRTLRQLGPQMQRKAHVSALANRLSALHLCWPVRIAFWLSRPLIVRNLMGITPNLKLFSFYKLGYYLGLKSKVA